VPPVVGVQVMVVVWPACNELPLDGLLMGFGPDGSAVCAATLKAASSGRKKLEKRIAMYLVEK